MYFFNILSWFNTRLFRLFRLFDQLHEFDKYCNVNRNNNYLKLVLGHLDRFLIIIKIYLDYLRK